MGSASEQFQNGKNQYKNGKVYQKVTLFEYWWNFTFFFTG